MTFEEKKTNVSPASLIVWDSEDDPPANCGTVLLWRSFVGSLGLNFVSVPNLVEADAVVLKNLYLKWVFDVGKVRRRGRRLVDYFEIRPGFSYWWMTPLVEKCNFAKSPQIDHAIRLMAFESWISTWKGTYVTLSSPNRELAECVRALCHRFGLGFEWRRTTRDTEGVSLLKRLYRQLPCSVTAFIWLARYLIERYPLKGVGLGDWVRSTGQTTFFSYLFNLAPLTQTEGKFESGYWAHLPAVLGCTGTKTNWLHLYVPDKLLPNAAAAAAIIRKFNNNGNGQQVHATLDSFLNVKVVFRTIRDFCRVFWIAARLNPRAFFALSNKLYFWPLYKKEWFQSFFGSTAMQNMLFLNLFEEAMGSIATQSVGTYLQENQGWEFALIHSWHSGGHGRIVGAPHSTVRFWDLRYFFWPDTYRERSRNALPLPDQVALNGAVAKKFFLDAGYPAVGLVEVEALRYLYLVNYRDNMSNSVKIASRPLQVLVVGDYLKKNTEIQMRLLEKSMKYLFSEIKFMIKPHPNCPIELMDYRGIGNMTMTMEPLSKLLPGSDVVFVGIATSAAVDAYCAGTPVIAMLDPNSLNLSPLRGREGVTFVTAPRDLAAALRSMRGPRSKATRRDVFFTLDSELSRWMKLLGGKRFDH